MFNRKVRQKWRDLAMRRSDHT